MKTLFRRKKTKAENKPRRNSKTQNERVISYYTASRRQLDSFERKKATADYTAIRHFKQVRKHWFFGLATMALVIIAIAGSTLGGQPYVKIEPLMYRPAEVYAQTASSTLKRDWRNNFKLIIRTSDTEKEILTQFSEARNVHIVVPFLGRSTEIYIDTDKPLAWFDQTSKASLILGQRGKLLLDASVLQKNEEMLSRSNLPGMRNVTGIEAKAGDQVLSPQEALLLQRLLAQYAQDKLQEQPSLELLPALGEIAVREPGGGGYAVRYLLNDDIEKQYGALRAIQKDLAAKNIVPKEYIDVRLVEKVYYK